MKMKMYHFDFLLFLLNWLCFAYDIEHDRDFWTWMWLGASIFFLGNAYAGYIIEKLKADKQHSEIYKN